MNVSKFEQLMAAFPREELQQTRFEWGMFLMFCVEYFRCMGVERPMVVEVGTYRGRQKPFYLDFLQARYVSIDCDPKAEPTILGYSEDEATVERLGYALQGSPIDLLFIDGNHCRAKVMMDYALYAPLTRHLVALHDVAPWPQEEQGGPMVFWEELRRTNINTVMFSGDWDCYPTGQHAHGIGVVVRNTGALG